MNEIYINKAKKSLFNLANKQQIKYNVIWIILIIIFLLSIVLIYPIIGGMVSGMPQEVKDMMEGMGYSLDYESVLQYFYQEASFIFIVGGLIYSFMLANTLATRDFKMGYSELIYTNGVSRSLIFNQRLKALIFQVLIFDLCIFVVSFVSMIIMEPSLSIISIITYFITATLVHIVLSVAFYSFASFKGKKGNTSGLAIALPFAFYIIDMIALVLKTNSQNFDLIKYLTPVSIFDTIKLTDIFVNFEYITLSIWIILSVVCFVFYRLKFLQKDIYVN